MTPQEEIKLEEVFNDEKRENIKKFIDEINNPSESNQEQGYSEEEVIELLKKALTHKDNGEIGSLLTAQKEIRPANFFSWFNKFKNK